MRFVRGSRVDNNYIPAIEVHTLRPAFRAGREGRQIEQVVVTFTQKVTADVGTDGDFKLMVFRGGCSLILQFGEENTVEYVVVKNIRSYRRFCEQACYIKGESENAAAPSSSLYSNDDRERKLDFNLLHRYSE